MKDGAVSPGLAIELGNGRGRMGLGRSRRQDSNATRSWRIVAFALGYAVCDGCAPPDAPGRTPRIEVGIHRLHVRLEPTRERVPMAVSDATDRAHRPRCNRQLHGNPNARRRHRVRPRRPGCAVALGAAGARVDAGRGHDCRRGGLGRPLRLVRWYPLRRLRHVGRHRGGVGGFRDGVHVVRPPPLMSLLAFAALETNAQVLRSSSIYPVGTA